VKTSWLERARGALCPLGPFIALALVAPPAGASVEEATRHLQSAIAAANAGDWEAALAEYTASGRAAPSVVALEGIANAQYQLGHDAEAYAAYTQLLAIQPQIPPGDVALQRSWARARALAEQRAAQLKARMPPPPSASTPEGLDRPPAESALAPSRPAEDHEEKDEIVRTAENAVFVELAGNGLIYSINYEHLFGDSNLSLRGGLSYVSLAASAGGESAKATIMTFPVLANYYIGGRDHKLQLGVGATFLYASESIALVSFSGVIPAPTAVIGYRYIPARGGFAFFIGLTPFLVPGSDKTFFPWGGTSFGGVF
jgi:hypothetical protein